MNAIPVIGYLLLAFAGWRFFRRLRPVPRDPEVREPHALYIDDLGPEHADLSAILEEARRIGQEVPFVADDFGLDGPTVLGVVFPDGRIRIDAVELELPIDGDR